MDRAGDRFDLRVRHHGGGVRAAALVRARLARALARPLGHDRCRHSGRLCLRVDPRALAAPQMILRGLYGMIDLPTSELSRDPANAALGLAAALVDGGARIAQLRMKGADAAAQLAVARVLAPWCHARAVTFIVNDRVDLALAAAADGVHLGQDDLPLDAARAI